MPLRLRSSFGRVSILSLISFSSCLMRSVIFIGNNLYPYVKLCDVCCDKVSKQNQFVLPQSNNLQDNLSHDDFFDNFCRIHNTSERQLPLVWRLQWVILSVSLCVLKCVCCRVVWCSSWFTHHNEDSCLWEGQTTRSRYHYTTFQLSFSFALLQSVIALLVCMLHIVEEWCTREAWTFELDVRTCKIRTV